MDWCEFRALSRFLYEIVDKSYLHNIWGRSCSYAAAKGCNMFIFEKLYAQCIAHLLVFVNLIICVAALDWWPVSGQSTIRWLTKKQLRLSQCMREIGEWHKQWSTKSHVNTIYVMHISLFIYQFASNFSTIVLFHCTQMTIKQHKLTGILNISSIRDSGDFPFFGRTKIKISFNSEHEYNSFSIKTYFKKKKKKRKKNSVNISNKWFRFSVINRRWKQTNSRSTEFSTTIYGKICEKLHKIFQPIRF